MKTIIIFLLITSSALSQSWVMKVSKKNGPDATFSIQDIRKITFDPMTDVREQQLMQNVLKKFALLQNYPNPFNPKTTIRYEVPRSGSVSLIVYDVLGKEIATLINSEAMEIGEHETQFDASNYPGGVYFYRLQVSENGKQIFSETKKLVLMK